MNLGQKKMKMNRYRQDTITVSRNRITAILAEILCCVVCFFPFPLTGWCQTDTVKDIKQPVAQSIQRLQKSQKERDQWEQEKTQLLGIYEQLQQKNEMLLSDNKDLTSKKLSLQALALNLSKQKRESARLQKELFPFLQDLYARLDRLIANDPPFLKKERMIRLNTLEKTLHDPNIDIAEKYRTVMEAVFIEAEYGATIEVYQDKITIGTQVVLGNIFRLGRVSLFFLSLDKKAAAYFNMSQKLWQPLPEDNLLAIRSAVEIGRKHRSVELLSLPLGRLSMGEENQ